MIRIEELADGRVAVSGLTVDEVRAKLVPRPPGRPPAAGIPAQDILEAIERLSAWWPDPSQRVVAHELGVTRFRLQAAVVGNFGSWQQLRAITGQSDVRDSTA